MDANNQQTVNVRSAKLVYPRPQNNQHPTVRVNYTMFTPLNTSQEDGLHATSHKNVLNIPLKPHQKNHRRDKNRNNDFHRDYRLPTGKCQGLRSEIERPARNDQINEFFKGNGGRNGNNKQHQAYNVINIIMSAAPEWASSGINESSLQLQPQP